ncbi:hypothetical protein [Nocardioides sp. L-11A]|uniref:hypothetical protein n=1 Tax=Nocardioides sp. L-11A TaxID=3043848 RepID=UPI00249B64A5|nr:hypothetical protein QJ852_09895 [Nocardioides sp. L-11A]
MTAAADRPPCQRCGQIHPRCTAHSKRSGAPCGRHPSQGQEVCKIHGGGSPQAIAAAERRQLVKAADRAMQDLWVGLDQATAVTDPVASLQKLAGALEQLVDETGRRVSTMDHLAGGQHLTALRGEVTLFERALARLADVLDKMARLGIAERHVELEQERAQLVIAAFRAAMVVLAERVTLLPADQDLVLRTFLEQLGTPDGSDAIGGAA